MEKFRRSSHFFYRTALLGLLSLAASIMGTGGWRPIAADRAWAAGSPPANASTSTSSPASPVAAPGPVSSTATTAPSGAVPTAPGTAVQPIQLTTADVFSLERSAASVEEIWEDFKWILPFLGAIFIAVIPVITYGGIYYIRNEGKRLTREVEGKLDNQVKEQKAQFNKKFAELNERITDKFQAFDAKMNFQGAGIRYKLALYAWRTGDLRDSIYQGETSLLHADLAIRLFKEVNDRKIGEARDLQSNLQYRCYIVGDLAFYCADAFKAEARVDDGARALELARRLRTEWAIFTELPPSLVDNYLYVLAVVDKIAPEDFDEARILRKDNQDRIMASMQTDNPKMAKEHTQLFEKFFGPI